MKKLYKIILSFSLIILFYTIPTSLNSQGISIVKGKVTNVNNEPIELVNIAVLGTTIGTATSKDGGFHLKVKANEKIKIVVSFVGYIQQEFTFDKLKANESKVLNIILEEKSTNLPHLVIEDKHIRSSNFNIIDPKLSIIIPSASDGIEAMLKTMPGVSSSNELSSQYSVRGGNFDENLVYVNDVEIYRPFLVRSGQQEGLSFLNGDLISSVLFSAGGFNSQYGDKMSSVLDIKYKRPTKFKGSASASLLGASMHIEGINKNAKLQYLFGARYKSNQYLLKGLETKGEYRPSFTDIQGLFIYKLNKFWEFSLFGNYANNVYNMKPKERTTSFGTLQNALQLTVFFEGEEKDKFENYMCALTTQFSPNNNLKLKLITSIFETFEYEAFDILGQYWIGEVETNLANQNFGKVIKSRGVGSYLNHARNKMDGRVNSLEHRGEFNHNLGQFMWGVKVSGEYVFDKLNEWILKDSAGFTLPYTNPILGDSGNQSNITISEVYKANNMLNSFRYSGFAQNTWGIKKHYGEWRVNIGGRLAFWDVNSQLLLSPRATFSFKPDWINDVSFRLSTGLFHQPPFFRELRNIKGELNKKLKAQSSIHFVFGANYNFIAWKRPFKLIAECYYKYLYNLVPYDIDNVKIRYSAENSAVGYAAGIDIKINGEFVKGLESWVSISLMQTKEDIKGDFYKIYFDKNGKEISQNAGSAIVDSVVQELGYIRRPTDQRLGFSIFFQDFLPRNPSYKIHLNLIFNTGLPFSSPGNIRGRSAFTMPSYRRVDIGFSKQLINKKKQVNSVLFKNIETAWVSLEILNLLKVENTVSYLWIKDVNNLYYAVPNSLTTRQINVKLSVTF